MMSELAEDAMDLLVRLAKKCQRWHPGRFTESRAYLFDVRASGNFQSLIKVIEGFPVEPTYDATSAAVLEKTRKMIDLRDRTIAAFGKIPPHPIPWFAISQEIICAKYSIPDAIRKRCQSLLESRPDAPRRPDAQ